jgi:alpha,alpha-trehalase
VPRWSSLLPLPNPYVVPGGRFREIYYWDSYFTMLGFGPREAPLRRAMVDNFADLIRRFGHVPNGSRTYYLSRSQPPFFFEMVALTDEARPARGFARYLGALKAEHRWWMRGERTTRRGQAAARVVRMPDGAILNRYWDDRAAPRDESYLADVRVAASAHDRPGVYRDIRAAAESGWDFSSRWLADGHSLATIRTTDIVPPDLNSLLTGLEEAISQGCAELRDRSCAADFRHRAQVRAAAIRHYLWNPRSHVFDDYLWREGRLAGNMSAATFYPLFLGIATNEQARAVAAAAGPRLLRMGGLATTDRQTGQQWDAPNGWAPLQWIAVRGLRNYGEMQLADEIARRWLGTVERVYGATGKLLEKYDVVTAQPGGGGEYSLQDGFGWTNGVAAALLASPVAKPGGSFTIRHPKP